MSYLSFVIMFVLSSFTTYKACVIVPQPVVLFPLNATYGTSDIKNRTAPGIPHGVSLAPGPHGKESGSYEFFGNSNSYIEFPNSPGGALDVRYSMTMLCWLYYDPQGGPQGPIFNYKIGSAQYGVHLWVYDKELYARFNSRDFTEQAYFKHTSLVGGWKFVGASYGNNTGEIKVWVDGALVTSGNIGAGVELGTQENIRMGARLNGQRCFKGRIAQMQIYDVALSQDQIMELLKQPEEPCRYMEFKSDGAFQSRRLVSHVIRTIENIEGDFCEALCYMEDNCVSFNMKIIGEPGASSTTCELNNSTHYGHPGDLQIWEDYFYHGIMANPCDQRLCQNNSTCQAGFTERGYRCLCGSGFCGEHCETDIDECSARQAECSANAVCHNLQGSYSCSCKEGYYGDGKNCTAANSCSLVKAITGEGATNGDYWLLQDGVKFKVYCHMESGDQSWTIIARFSNNDFREWMRAFGQWWFTKIHGTGATGQTSRNDDMISPAFWLVSGKEFKITRSDDPHHVALLRTTGDCLGGETFRAKITSYGTFTDESSWETQQNADGCRGSCNVSYGGRYEETAGFRQANCSGRVQSAEKISFWCAIESSGSVMMIGGGGEPCTLGDHGIGIISSTMRSFELIDTRHDFGDLASSSSEDGYSLNLWIQ
ncbi:uncharacterized protein [Montipora capricornis]|uniref:uncharacterized protein isoform X2 n=1 Tax=Montipora capricornis TaxID=246305 RepID=UPI0035F11358